MRGLEEDCTRRTWVGARVECKVQGMDRRPWTSGGGDWPCTRLDREAHTVRRRTEIRGGARSSTSSSDWATKRVRETKRIVRMSGRDVQNAELAHLAWVRSWYSLFRERMDGFCSSFVISLLSVNWRSARSLFHKNMHTKISLLSVHSSLEPGNCTRGLAASLRKIGIG